MNKWTVWTNNPIVEEWTFEFEGTREDCLKYLTLATGDDACRLWEFSIRHPA